MRCITRALRSSNRTITIQRHFTSMMIRLFLIFFLYAIPGDVAGRDDFSCDQPFGTKPDQGFSLVNTVSFK